MISFDRNSTNLTAVWNEINSIEVDTESMWNILSNMDTSVLSTLSDIPLSLSSIISDTLSLSSSVTDIMDSLSTLSGGGDYYYNLSDLVSKSYNYMYNVTGNYVGSDLPSYSSFTIAGYMGTISNFTLNSDYKTVCFSGVDLLSSFNLSWAYYVLLNVNSLTSFTITGCKLININVLNGCGLPVIDSVTKLSIECSVGGIGGNVNRHINSVTDCYLAAYGMASVNMSACNKITCNFSEYLNGCNFNDVKTCFVTCSSITKWYVNTGTYYNIIADKLVSCSLKSISHLDCNCLIMSTVTIYSNTIYDLNVGYMSSCNINFNSLLKPLNITYCYKNNIVVGECNLTLNAGFIQSGAAYGAYFDSNDPYQLDCYINVNTLLSSYDVKSFNLVSVKADTAYNGLYFQSVNTLILNVKNPNWSHIAGGIGFYVSNIKLIDARQITKPITVVAHTNCNASRMMLNCDWRWTTSNGYYSTVRINQSKFSTIDFYNVENYLSSSTFTIPLIYSGYDENNIWISGKPLTYYSYTLSLSSQF